MADDFDDRFFELAGGDNRLAELYRQVTSSLDALVAKARRLGDVLDAAALAGGTARPGAAAPSRARPAPLTVPGAPAGTTTAQARPTGRRADDRTEMENTRANQRTAEAVEELVRNGIRLRDVPPAVYGE